MILRELEVSHWMGLVHRQLRELGPGLNLVVGPNEAGKSRLFRALQAAFFERHASTSLGELGSWASGETPTVRVVFELEGARWQLRKGFVRRAFCELSGPGGTLQGAEAEARLRALLGTDEVKRGKSRPEHQGLFPLLWVAQGEMGAGLSAQLHDGARASLADQLSGLVGVASAGPKGEALLKRAREEAAALLTKTGRPAGRYKAAVEAHEAALLEQAEAQAEHARVEGALAALIEARRQLEAARAEAKALEPKRAEAIGAAEAARADAARVEAAQGEVQRFERERAHLHEAAARDRLQQAQLQEAREAVRLAEGAVAEGREALALLAPRLEAAEASLREARSAEGAAGQLLRQVGAEQARRALRDDLQALDGVLARAQAVYEERLSLEASTEARRLGPQALDALEASARRLWEADHALSVAAAELDFEALAQLEVDGEARAAGARWTRRFDQEAVVSVGEGLQITVRPGGVDLAQRRAARDQALAAHQAGLAQAGLRDLDEARARARELAALEGRLREAQAELAGLAPEGLGALEARRGALSARLEAAAAELAGGHEGGLPSPAEAEGARAQAEEGRRQAEAVAAALAGQRDQEAQALRGAEGRLEALREALSAAIEAQPPEAQLQARTEALAGAEARLEAATRAISALDPARAERALAQTSADLERIERALSNKVQARHELQDQVARHEAALEALQGRAEGPAERLQEAERRVEQGAAQRAQLELRAEAARRLVDALDEAKQALHTALTGPIVARVAPLLTQIFPQLELQLGDSFEIEGLGAGPALEPFEALSAGAREQVELAVRGAFAALLGDGGQARPLILDDPLVNTDAQRQEAMLRVIYQLAQQGQILLFTCHGGAYAEAGEDARFELAPGRGAGAEAPGGPTAGADTEATL